MLTCDGMGVEGFEARETAESAAPPRMGVGVGKYPASTTILWLQFGREEGRALGARLRCSSAAVVALAVQTLT